MDYPFYCILILIKYWYFSLLSHFPEIASFHWLDHVLVQNSELRIWLQNIWFRFVYSLDVYCCWFTVTDCRCPQSVSWYCTSLDEWLHALGWWAFQPFMVNLCDIGCGQFPLPTKNVLDIICFCKAYHMLPKMAVKEREEITIWYMQNVASLIFWWAQILSLLSIISKDWVKFSVYSQGI